MTDIKATSVLDLVRRYYDAISRFDPEAAVECFSQDARYSHPPYPSGVASGFDPGPTGRIEVQGRENILALLRARGDLRVTYDITACLSDGSITLVEGQAQSPNSGSGPFVVSLRINPDGLIDSYTGFK